MGAALVDRAIDDQFVDDGPDEIERAFEETRPIGRDFGTVLVLVEGFEIEHTTFRSDGAYRDNRRPESVRYGSTPDEDARRRDFTCNALYLDPLTDETLDPTGGLTDLERGVLATVGRADERFGEDGLRLLRMARLAATHELDIDRSTAEGARSAAGALDGVSPERVLAELGKAFGGAGGVRFMRLLDATQLVDRALDGATSGAWDRRRSAVLSALDGFERGPATPLGLELGIVALAAVGAGEAEWTARLERLRPSRATRKAVVATLGLAERADALLERFESSGRSERLRLVREDAWPDASRLVRARRIGRDLGLGELDRLDRLRADTPGAALRPDLLLDASDFRSAGVPQGPRFGVLRAELEAAQLDGLVEDRAGALEWLAARLSELDASS